MFNHWLSRSGSYDLVATTSEYTSNMGCDPKFVHDSIADIPEDQLVARLLSDPTWPSDFFELVGMPRGMSKRQSVLLHTAPGNYRGDIDVLLCDPDRAEHAVAYQIKRVKFGIDQIRAGKPNKLSEFRKLVQQANLLVEMGFWQVYAYVVIVVDTREQNSGRLTYQGLSPKLRSLVDQEISLELLHPRIGLGILDFTQPMDCKPFAVGTQGLHLRRLASSAPQNPALTQWITTLFERLAT